MRLPLTKDRSGFSSHAEPVSCDNLAASSSACQRRAAAVPKTELASPYTPSAANASRGAVHHWAAVDLSSVEVSPARGPRGGPGTEARPMMAGIVKTSSEASSAPRMAMNLVRLLTPRARMLTPASSTVETSRREEAGDESGSSCAQTTSRSAWKTSG